MKSKNLMKVSLASLLLASPILEASAFTVGLDAGHGQHTPGKRAVDNSFHEWEINDRVADYLQPMLESKGITVYRLDDTTGQNDISLNERLRRAINYDIDLVVSLHQNATGDGWTEATGIETYYNVLGSAKSQELAKQAANKMSEYMNEKNRGAKTANLFITREFTAVGIDANLYEGSFMSNKEDVEQMKTNTYAENYAKAVAESILNVYRNEISSEPFVVQVRKDLNETLTVRNKPHYTGEYVTELVPGECVTIVSVKDGWGELKSGLGYINLSSKYTEEITLN